MSSIPAFLSMLAKATMRLSENCSSLSLFFKEKSLERALKEFRQTNGKIALNSGKVIRHHRLDIRPFLKEGDSQRNKNMKFYTLRWFLLHRDCPEEQSLVFAIIPTVGNFTGLNQPPIPPGLTISPQADTACPAAISFMKEKRQRVKAKIPVKVRITSPP